MLSGEEVRSPGRRSLLQFGVALVAAGSVPGALAQAAADSAGTFTAKEQGILLALGEALVPGADLPRFLTHMLARRPHMLCYPFVSFPLDTAGFYRTALGALERASVRERLVGFAELSRDGRTTLLRELVTGQIKEWDGPPPALVYFVVRNDAVDAVYGSPDAYRAMNVPYMAHISPPALE
jgi:hypothetical protein